MEKDQSTYKIEAHISNFKKTKDFDALPNQTTSSFILVDYTAVKLSAYEKIEEWL